MQEFHGGCHCGNLRLEVRLSLAPETMQVRACQCTFCRMHGAHSISDPKGFARIAAARPADVSRYRFGLKTADFIICAKCGVYIGAVCETPSGLKAVINVNVLKDRARFTAMPQAFDYEGEDAGARLARREARWMPVEVTWGTNK